MGIYWYTRVVCRRRHETIAAIQDPFVIEDDDQQNIGSGDHSPLEDAPLTHEKYLQEYEDYLGGKNWVAEYL